MISQYRKKPVVIEAAQLSKENQLELYVWCGGSRKALMQNTGKAYIDIDTLEGTMTANEGDYIIKGVKGEFYPCKPHIFDATYDAVDATELQTEGESRTKE